MTRRAAIALVVANGIAVAGIAVRPLLHREPPPRPQRGAAAMATRAPDTTAAATAAASSAVRALACAPPTATPSSSPRHSRAVWCGRYTVSRRQTTCATAETCTVELLGTLTSRATSTVVALIVTVHRDSDGWAVTAVRS